MRGVDHQQNHMFSYLSPERRVRQDHPLRAIRVMVDEVLTQLSRRFDRMYASAGRPSIPPEKLLRAQLLQMLYSIRSERLLMEEIECREFFCMHATSPLGCTLKYAAQPRGKIPPLVLNFEHPRGYRLAVGYPSIPYPTLDRATGR